MPVYLNAISGEGVHVITVNEYLSERDATEMGELYSWLGLSVGINLSSKSPAEKREAYNCDITYSTSSEVGFDYLRDNMVVRKENMVQRPLTLPWSMRLTRFLLMSSYTIDRIRACKFRN